jgi:hypothetical protein
MMKGWREKFDWGDASIVVLPIALLAIGAKWLWFKLTASRRLQEVQQNMDAAKPRPRSEWYK